MKVVWSGEAGAGIIMAPVGLRYGAHSNLLTAKVTRLKSMNAV